MDNQKLRQKTLDRVSVVLLLNSEYVMKTAMLIRTYFLRFVSNLPNPGLRCSLHKNFTYM